MPNQGTKMKIIIASVLALAAASATAQVHVHGYTKANGTYVAPHEKTEPNHTINDNYSTKGNVNPYTGKEGTVNPPPSSWTAPPPPQPAPPAPAYDSGYKPVKLLPANKF